MTIIEDAESLDDLAEELDDKMVDGQREWHPSYSAMLRRVAAALRAAGGQEKLNGAIERVARALHRQDDPDPSTPNVAFEHEGAPCQEAYRDRARLVLTAAAPVGGQAEPSDARIGFSVWLDREQWGLVGDGLMAQRELLLERKRINSESTADLSADAVADVLRLLNAADPITGAAAVSGGQATPTHAHDWRVDTYRNAAGSQTRRTCQTCRLVETDPYVPAGEQV